MITSDGEEHSHQRREVSRFFRPGSAKRLEEKFREYARDVVNAALAKGEPFDFIDEIAHVMPMQALGDVLGVPQDDRPKFFGWVDTFASRVRHADDAVVRGRRGAIIALYEYALELAELKRASRATTRSRSWSPTRPASGCPTTRSRATSRCWPAGRPRARAPRSSHGMQALMRNPEQMAWLRERADDVPSSAVQEILRIASPFTHLVRTANADVEIAGQEIKEGERVAMMFASANFDPDVFEEPRKFEPDPRPQPAPELRPRTALLPRQARRRARDQDPARGAAAAHEGHPPGRRDQLHARGLLALGLLAAGRAGRRLTGTGGGRQREHRVQALAEAVYEQFGVGDHRAVAVDADAAGTAVGVHRDEHRGAGERPEREQARHPRAGDADAAAQAAHVARSEIGTAA